MSKYKLFHRAKRELEDIWYYTEQRWGEPQANKYLQELAACMQRAALKQIPWRKLPKEAHLTNIDVYLVRYKRHYIFFRELGSDQIAILSVLHDAMDIPRRLSEVLKKMDDWQS